MQKTILITGSTAGIGKLAAIQLAKAGHQVYLHGRSAKKLQAVIAEVEQVAQVSGVKGFIADFSNLDAVRKMAAQVLSEVPQLDILINNAGVFKSPIQTNKDGLDLRIVVNYLAPYVMTEQLIPLLQKSPQPRIINLSSAAQDPVSLEVLSGHAQDTTRATYGQSKLALTMWSFHLAKTWPDIITIPVNPGSLLDTRMVREGFGQVWAPADKGADILYRLAVGEEFADKSGQYFDNDRGGFGPAHPDAYDEAKIERVVRATATLLLD